MNRRHRQWWPLALRDELGVRHPLARTLLGVPLVLFRDARGQPAVLLDRCPHRQAPLSAGRLHDGELACPYHGWRFDGSGRCTRVPGIECDLGTKPSVHALATCEAHGLVWACLEPTSDTAAPVAPASTSEAIHTFFMTGSVNCTLADAAENFLDGFHTHFVHSGWVRRDRQRQTVDVRVRSWSDGVEAHYSGEGKQLGLVSQWFEPERSESMGRFQAPGMAEIEYRGLNKRLNLLVTVWLTPETNDRLRIHARIATGRGWLPAWLKRIVLRRLFGVILAQDRAILEKVHANASQCRQHAPAEWMRGPLDGAQDFLGPSIRILANGERLTENSALIRSVRL
jgi:phenylpropionate dioxygenase-like ring-hydroxylating dioxygenase large terminal subunit